MKMLPGLLGFLLMAEAAALSAPAANPVAADDVTWTSLGVNENSSMPIGNGDLAANVWTEANGDLVLLLAKSDAWTELGKLVKLGRVRVKLSPNPWIGAADFTQTLKLEDGSVEIKSGRNVLQLWADANHPVLHVVARLTQPATLQATLELWRTARPDNGGMFELSGPIQVETTGDTVFPRAPEHAAWCHFNVDSIYPTVLREEHLGAVVGKYPDPLLHRCFGAVMSGPGLVGIDDKSLKSSAPTKNLRLDLVTLTTLDTASPAAWLKQALALARETRSANLQRARTAHQRWWQSFWDRS